MNPSTQSTRPPLSGRTAVILAQRKTEAQAKANAPITATSPAKRRALAALLAEHPGNSSAAQRTRLLVALERWPLSTVEIRDLLDIPAPSARIAELRDADFEILTHWSREQSVAGVVHRFGRYVLSRGPA